MKTLYVIAILIGIGLGSKAQDKAQDPPKPKIEFRKPFTLKLHIDEEHFYEETFKKIPYVHDGDVYLFSGEEFGISLTITGGEIEAIRYEKDLKKADVAFKFSQVIDEDKKDAMMMCRITNKTKRKIFFDGLMTIPGKEGIFRTSILPLEPKLTNFESWPHPIVQLVLRNIRLKDEAPTDGRQGKTEQSASEASGKAEGKEKHKQEEKPRSQ